MSDDGKVVEVFEYRPAYDYRGRSLVTGNPSKTVEEFKAALVEEQATRKRYGQQP